MTELQLDFTLRRDRLYEQVADQIESLIVSESLRPDDKLPSERNLAERLGVSRTVIREATRVLNVRGLVVVKPGSGTYIQKLSPSDAAAPIGLFLKMQREATTFQNLCEVRHTLEVDIAGLAAERATDKDTSALETAMEQMAGHVTNAEQFVQNDLDFHSALAAATHNDLYKVLLTPITDLLFEFRLAAYQYDAQNSIAGGLTYHRRILDCIKTRDVEGARQAMREHLNQAQNLFETARQ
jgi:GntR family transcriptional repressor for pyruvate dehydrogenase complex